MTDNTQVATEKLGVAECWSLLRAADFGRLAVWVEGHPEIIPVNHVVDHGSLVFRTAYGSRIAVSQESPEVAFEIDGYDAGIGEAWSVVVKGRNSRIVNLHELIDGAQLPLQPWHAGPKHQLVRLEPDEVSGRRFSVTDPSVWSAALTASPQDRPE